MTNDEIDALLADTTPGPWDCTGCLFPDDSLGGVYYRLHAEGMDARQANARLIAAAPTLATALRQLQAERDTLKARVEALEEAQWYYLGDDCSSDQCRLNIDECISEDFEWANKPEGDHVLQISGARAVPDMWIALHYFTEDEKDEWGDDESYTYTVHATEEEARQALKGIDQVQEANDAE